MNTNVSYFSAGIQTPAEIEELSRCHILWQRLSDQRHVAAAALALRFRTKNICWPKASGRFQTQLCQGTIDK